MTHTPGPWHTSRNGCDIKDSKGRLIATFYWVGRYPENEAEGKSNHALGLSAPDMKLALEHVRDGKTDMNEIMAAIAKAEGR